MPAGVDAASLPVNYVTAYQMLFRVAKVNPGERILVHGAAGGVGTALLQLGGLQGLEMYGTASARKHDLVSGLGATPIDYKAEDFVERVRALPDDGVDAVFDHLGGAHVARSFRTLRRGGRLVWYGLSAGLAGGSALVLGAATLGRIALWNALPNGKRATFYTTVYTDPCSHLLLSSKYQDKVTRSQREPKSIGHMAIYLELGGTASGDELLRTA